MFSKLKKYSDSVVRKFIDVINLNNWQVKSDTGWTDIKSINKTIPYIVYIIKFESGNTIKCADNHIFIDNFGNEIFAKNCLDVYLKTEYGDDKVIEVINTKKYENMYDFSLADDSNHLYYANGVLSHNSTLMTIVAVWTALFFPDQTIAIVANKQSTATEIFNRVRLAFIQMDNWIKGGVEEFNKTFFTLSNGSRIITSATSPDAIRGLTIDVLLLDEFAIIPPKVADEFWAAVTPTLATRFNNNKNAKLIVASTPKGVGNKFHDLVSKAEQHKNDFKVEKALWSDFPGRDEAWKDNEVSTLGYDLFTQEYECRFLNNSGSPFDASMFDKFISELIEPINILEEGRYLIWKLPEPDRIYTMGIDTGEGTDQDYSVAQIFDITDPLNIEQVARYSSNKIDTTTWASKLIKIAKQWYSPIVLIERNGPGTTPCDKFFNEWNYPRMINYGFKEAGGMRSGRGFRPGIISTRNSKMLAVTNMKYYIHDRRVVKIYDKQTIEELRTFARIKGASGNYKWEAQPGFHDDHVCAMLWALFVLHTNVIDNWLIIREKNGDGIPLKLEKKWEFRPETDFEDSLYKSMENTSPFIGVVVLKDRVISDPRLQDRDKVGTLEHLLNHGDYISLAEYNERTSFPSSFNQYEVRTLSSW